MEQAWIDFWVHVRPGSRKDAIEGTHDGVLAIRVSAPPTEGKANHAVCKAVAEAFGVARLDVKVVGGRTGKRKLLRVYGDPAVLGSRLEQMLGAHEQGVPEQGAEQGADVREDPHHEP